MSYIMRGPSQVWQSLEQLSLFLIIFGNNHNLSIEICFVLFLTVMRSARTLYSDTKLGIWEPNIRLIACCIYKTLLGPMLIYGSESLVVTKHFKSKLQAVQMKFLRSLKCRSWIAEQVYRDWQQLKWFGHLVRMVYNWQTVKVLKARRLYERKKEDQVKHEMMCNTVAIWTWPFLNWRNQECKIQEKYLQFYLPVKIM